VISEAAVAGVVEQDVEAAEGLLGRGHGLGDVGLKGHVAVDVAHPIREALLEHRALFVLHVGGHHHRPFGDEQLHRAKSDSRCGAGDHRHLAVQPPCHASLP
jgi:hypothetical protein